MKPTIFVSIAAYREFELLETLRDMLAQAESPDRLRICICWQHADDDSLEEFEADPRFDIIDVPYRESRGVCWARNSIQQRYGGEAYFLQIDGHHRFAPQWDRRAIEMIVHLQKQGHPKPILTGYVPGYDPWNDPAGRTREVWATGIDRFEPAGVVFMRPARAPEKPTEPMPCRFWSAHFSFSPGCFNEEVLVDPTAYFHSEEIVMGVRAWTKGYDLFNPHETLIWHEYTRRKRVCHWDDHQEWVAHHDRTVDRYRRMFGIDGTERINVDPYGFGSVRSFHDFERYAGIEFATRGVQPHTVANTFPPDPLQHAPEEEWRESLLTSHSNDVYIERSRLDVDCDMWAIFANAEDGTEIFREEYMRPRYREFLDSQPGDHISFFIAFFDKRRPHTWTVWPHSRERGWLERTKALWVHPQPSPPLTTQDLEEQRT